MASTLSTHALGETHHQELRDPSSINRWTELATKYWLKSTTSRKINPDTIKLEIWDVLQHNRFEYSSLLALENLQLLERWMYKSAVLRLVTNNVKIPMACI